MIEENAHRPESIRALSSEVGDIVRDSLHQLEELFHAEVKLIKLQAVEHVQVAKRVAIAFSLAAVFAHCALLFLALGVFVTLGADATAAWICAGGFALISIAMAIWGRKLLQPASPADVPLPAAGGLADVKNISVKKGLQS